MRQAVGSLQVLALGLSVALILGIALGLLMGRYRLAEYLLDPYVYAFDATPRVALIPLLLLWFGLGTSSKIAIVFLSGLFPVLMNTFSGVRTVSAQLVEVGRAYGAGEGKLFTKIIVPAALPFIMAGIRLAIGRALIGIITAEMFAAVTGIGALLIRYSSALATDKFFVPVILLALSPARRRAERCGGKTPEKTCAVERYRKGVISMSAQETVKQSCYGAKELDDE